MIPIFGFISSFCRLLGLPLEDKIWAPGTTQLTPVYLGPVSVLVILFRDSDFPFITQCVRMYAPKS